MTKLQDALVIRGKLIKNRIVMEPIYTFSFHGDDGCFYGRQHIEHYEARAKGGAGLIIIQATSCLGASDNSGQWTDGDKAALRTIAQKCQDHGAAVIMQLACGNLDINSLSPEEIRAMQREITNAAVTAYKLGYDGVEFHFAHGFTLCKFIDAEFNRRTDNFGGAAENRTSVLTEILPDIRSNTSDSFILGIRMGEFLPEPKDGVELARLFENAGIDLLNISFGMRPPSGPVPDGFICSPMALSGCRIKQAVKSVPVIAAGVIRTAEQARFLVENDYVDLIGIGTAFLADPSFADHILLGAPVNACLECTRCFWWTDHTKCPARK